MSSSRVWAGLLAGLLLAGCQSMSTPVSEDDRPVALLDGQPVARGLYDACLRNSFTPATHDGTEPDQLNAEVRSRMLDQLLDEQILALRGREAGLVVLPNELDGFLSELGVGPFDEAHGDASFVERKWLRRYAEDSLMVKKFLEGHVIADVDVTGAEVEAAYEANLSDYTRPTRYRLHQIRVEQLREARDLKKRIRSDGKNWDDVVARLNASAELDMGAEEQGLDLGLWTAEQLPGSFAEAVAKLETGHVAEDIKDADGGYNFLLLAERQDAYVVPIDEVRQQVRARLERERGSERVAGYLEQARADATIELVHENLDFSYVQPEAAASRALAVKGEGEGS